MFKGVIEMYGRKNGFFEEVVEDSDSIYRDDWGDPLIEEEEDLQVDWKKVLGSSHDQLFKDGEGVILTFEELEEMSQKEIRKRKICPF
ncbi:hypothetical protein CMO92_03025 [Candidatus Woesearchaeota archaeon]|nr:hypothetical protein [Candidatus Woesearchaeota archaeon]